MKIKIRVLLVALVALMPLLAHAGAAGYIGVKYLGDLVAIDFDSFNSAGASSSTTGFTTSDVKIYKFCPSGSYGGTPTAHSNNGYTLVDSDGLDVDGHTGFNVFVVDTANTSDAGFYQSGCDYLVHIDNVTIDSQTVRLTARFSLDPNVLSFGTLSADSASTSTAKVGTTGITFINQYAARVIWNVTTNERQCVTSSTDASPDVITFAPNVPAIWHSGDRYKIMSADAPCYPVTLPTVSNAGGVYIAGYVSPGVADVDSDIGRNSNTFFKNGGAVSLLTLDNVTSQFSSISAAVGNVPAALLATAVDGSLTLKCLLALDHATLVNSYTSTVAAAPYVTTFKDPTGSSTRIIQNVTSLSRSPTTTCPP